MPQGYKGLVMLEEEVMDKCEEEINRGWTVWLLAGSHHVSFNQVLPTKHPQQELAGMNQSLRDFVFHSLNEAITLSRFSLVGIVTHKLYSKIIN